MKTKIMPSIRSRIPPCPGNNFPVSLTENFLFKKEKYRSPTWQKIENDITNNRFTKLKSNIICEFKKFIDI